jgi:hypothetical protein
LLQANDQLGCQDIIGALIAVLSEGS